MKKYILSIIVAAVLSAIVGCGQQSPVSVQSNPSQVASGGPDYSITCITKDTVTGKMLLLAGNLQNNSSNLWYRNQTSGSTWAAWSRNSSIISGGAVATCNSGIGGKRLYLFNVGTNYHLWYNIATTSTLPNGWMDLGALPSGANVGQAKVAKLGLSPTSPLIVFASEQWGGSIWFKGTNSSGNFLTSSSSWIQIPSPAGSDFAVCTKNDGTIFVAFRNPNTSYIGVAIISSLNGVSNYYCQGLFGTTGQIAVGKNLDGRMEIFTFSGSSTIYHSWESSVNSNAWSAWTSTFGPSGRPLNALAPLNMAVAANADGRLELFYQRVGSRIINHTYQTAPNSGWVDESELYSSSVMEPLGYGISVALSLDNKLYLALHNASNYLYLAQHAPNSYWDAPVSLGEF